MSVTTQEKATPRYEHFVEDQLTRAQRRIRWLDTGTAVLIIGIATLGYALGMALLDRWFELSAYTRQAAFAVYALVTGIYLVWAVVRPILQNVNPYYAAQQVERTLPDPKNSLVNWLDLKERPLPGAIRGAVTHRAAKDFAHADIEQAFDAHRAVWLSACLLALAFGLVILFLQGPPQFFSLLDRAFAPFRSSPLATRTQLHILKPPGGDATVQVGRAVGFQLRVDGRIPDRSAPDAIRFLFRYQPNVPYEERAVDQGETTGEFTLTLPAYDVHNGFWYKFQGGDAETPEFQIRVRSAPLVTDFDVTYHFRPYLRRADQTSRDPNLEAVEHTEVMLIAHTNRVVRSGRLDVGDEQSVEGELVSTDPRALRFPLTIKSDATYKIAFVSSEGEKSEDPAAFTIHAIPDRPPVVEISDPRDVTLPANGILKVRGSATDDFGLRRLSLHLLQCEPDVLPYREGKPLRMEDGSYPRQLDYKGFVDLSKIQMKGWPLRPGQVIEYWLEALDNCDFRDNVGQGKHYKITIAEPQDPAQQARQRQQAQADQDRHEQEQQQQVGGKPDDEPKDGHKSGQGSKSSSDRQEGTDSSKDRDLQNRADQLSRAIDEQKRNENKQQGADAGQDKQQQKKQADNGSGGNSQENQKQSDQKNDGGSGSKQDQNQQQKQGGNGSGGDSQENQPKSDQNAKGGSGGKQDQQQQKQGGNGSGGDDQANQKQSDQGKEGGSGSKQDQARNQGNRGRDNPGGGGSGDGNQNKESQSKETGGSKSQGDGKAGGNQSGDGASQKSGSEAGGKDRADHRNRADKQNGREGSSEGGKASSEQGAAKGGNDAGGQRSGNEDKGGSKKDGAQAGGGEKSGQKGQEKSSGSKSDGMNAAGERAEQKSGSEAPSGTEGSKAAGQKRDAKSAGQSGAENRSDADKDRKAATQGDEDRKANQGGTESNRADQARENGGKSSKSDAKEAGKSSAEQARDSSDAKNGSEKKRDGSSAEGTKTGDQGERSASGESKRQGKEGQESGSKQANKDAGTPAADGRGKASGAGEERPATDVDVPELLKRLKNGDASVRRESLDKLNQMKDGIKDPALRQKVEKAVQESGMLEKMAGGKEQSPGKPGSRQEQAKDGGNQSREQQGERAQQQQPPSGIAKNAEGVPTQPSGNLESKGGDSSQVAGRRVGEPTNGADQGAPSASDQRFQRMPGQLQLDYIEKHITPDVLKKLNMTPQEYQQFLKDYAERARRQAARPGSAEKLTDPRAIGNTVQNRGSRQVKPGMLKEDRSSHAGQLEAPPEYRESYRDFTQKLAGEKSAEPAADREKK
jgi:hypothetical protein